jgi:hypothetical protein
MEIRALYFKEDLPEDAFQAFPLNSDESMAEERDPSPEKEQEGSPSGLGDAEEIMVV